MLIQHLYFIQTYCIIITYGKITEHEEFRKYEKERKFTKSCKSLLWLYYSGGGGKPALLKAFSRFGLLIKLTPHPSPQPYGTQAHSAHTSPVRPSVPQGARETVKPAFTLAEVLITLAIIGIVAALTIPGLMNKINSKVVENQKKVMNNKIVQGLNLLNSQENGLTKTYANSEEFVRALSKYMKMTTICGSGNLKDCFAYDKVNYDNNGEVKSVELSSITSASKLKLDDSFLAPAGFVMGDGTPVIVAWNSKCASGAQDATILDPDQPLKGIPTTCFDGLYDNSGTRNPNMYGKDVLPFGAAKIGTSYPGVEIPGIGYVYAPNGGVITDDQALAYGPEMQKWDPDYYANVNLDYCEAFNYPCKSYIGAAKKICSELGMDLPTEQEFIKIAQENRDLLLGSNGFNASAEAGWVCTFDVSLNRTFCGESASSGGESSGSGGVLCIGR